MGAIGDIVLTEAFSEFKFLNLDDNEVLELTEGIESEKKYFSSGTLNEHGCSIINNYICYKNNKIIHIDDIRIKGKNNYENIKSTQTALSSFSSPIILIMGGLDRGQSFSKLGAFLDNVTLIACYGETKNRIFDFANELNIPFEVVDTLEEATLLSFHEANQGYTILLSPLVLHRINLSILRYVEEYLKSP